MVTTLIAKQKNNKINWNIIVKITLAVFITFIISLGGCAIFARSYFIKHKKREDREVHKMLEHIANKQNESQMILASLNMGVIAYSSDGVLLLNNEAAMQILEEIPHNFQDFLDIYDVDQKLRSRMLLGNKQAEIDYTSNHKYYKMSLEERELGRNRPSGHIVVIQDISQQVREEEQRKEFVANVSHELKTPLTTIKTYSESLIDWGIDEKSRDAVKKDINKLYNGSLRMETLIDDLLLLSRIDGRAIYTRIEKMNLMPLVRSCVERMYTQADVKNIDFSSYAISDKTMAYVDHSAFERIIMNLVSNAIKYTPEFGQVKIYVGNLVDEVYIKVTDNGKGIPAAAQKDLFKRFYRVDSTGSREHGGTGLGLAIVKELIDLHSGQIDLKSEAGQGSEFTILLPRPKKVLRSTLYELTEKGSCSNMVTKSAEDDLRKLAEELGIVAQWKSLKQRDIDLILQEIENRF